MTTLISPRLPRRPLICLGLASPIVASLVLGSSLFNDRADAQNQAPMPSTAVAMSRALATAPALFTVDVDGSLVARAAGDASPPEYDASSIEQAAKSISAEIPFPPGLNSASHFNWSDVLDSGPGGATMGDADLRRVIQANALRDWAWYAANHTLTDDERLVAKEIASWSAFRHSAGGISQYVEKVMSLGQTDEAKQFAAGMFRESGGRPVPSRW